MFLPFLPLVPADSYCIGCATIFYRWATIYYQSPNRERCNLVSGRRGNDPTNLQLDVDTIAAIATPNGRGGVSIIRISGPQACTIGEHITQGGLTPRRPLYVNSRIRKGTLIDEGLTLFLKAPALSPVKDVVELHGHGGVVITHLLLQACLDLGARLARPESFPKGLF
ncbi:MAG: hypothetical protein CM15mP74_13400 [Halieaceae bacterium]|nr:MAG: hypothetical protein CM15mP74_13400 [Halieaceae bacterium]